MVHNFEKPGTDTPKKNASYHARTKFGRETESKRKDPPELFAESSVMGLAHKHTYIIIIFATMTNQRAIGTHYWKLSTVRKFVDRENDVKSIL